MEKSQLMQAPKDTSPYLQSHKGWTTEGKKLDFMDSQSGLPH